MPNTLPPSTTEAQLVHPVIHPDTPTGSIGYTSGDVLPATHKDDDSPNHSRPQTPSHPPHRLTQEEEMRINILNQVKHAQDSTRAGREDAAHREASRSRSRARKAESKSNSNSRETSLARGEGGSTSRSGSRAREFIHKVFGSREGSREPSRERPAVTKVDGQGFESSSGDIVGPTLLHTKHI